MVTKKLFPVLFFICTLMLFTGCINLNEENNTNTYNVTQPVTTEEVDVITDVIDNIAIEGTETVTLKQPSVTSVQVCQDEGVAMEDCWYPITVFLDENGEKYPVPAGTLNNAKDKWAYIDEYTIYVFDSLTDQSQELMSVYDTTDGVSYAWSPDDSKLAIVVINQQDESYNETGGSKLFIFSFDEDGVKTDKDRYLLKIKYGCHDAGCNSVSGEDFYFEDNDTLIYYTWDVDPYIERTDEYKEVLSLN